jgi:small subunit ribosomal protein S5
MGRGRQRTAEVQEGPAYDDNVVKVYRCAKVVKGGRRFSFAALVAVGDRNGRVGLGYGKANEVPNAVEKGRKQAIRAMQQVRLSGSTIPHMVTGSFGASRVRLIPASEGTGVIAGSSVRAILELAGVHDCLTKAYGSTSPKNLAKATLQALTTLRDRQTVERLRGVSLAV